MKTRAAFLSLVALASLAAAQDQTPALAPGISSQLQDVLGGALDSPSKGGAAETTTFTPTGKPLFVDVLLSKMTLDDTQKVQFRKYASQVLNLVETAYAQDGFPKNDMAVAIGGLLETGYELDQGTFTLSNSDKAKDAEDKRNTQAVIAQVRRALSAIPSLKKVANSDRQLAYEACTFAIGNLAVSWKQAGGETTKQDAIKASVKRQILSIFKIDVSALTRKANGELTPKSTQTPSSEAGGELGGRQPEPARPAKAAIRRGGVLKPGIYAGNQYYGQTLRDQLKLYIYSNGQYRMFNKGGGQTNSFVAVGYKYDPATGKFDMDNGVLDMMWNNSYEPKDDYCFYGYDQTGKPFVYGFSNRGISNAVSLLRYVGPTNIPSPAEETETKERLAAEARRYKWVTQPGKGLKPSQITGVLLNEQLSMGMETKMVFDVYLLLADGTIYNGLPVAPDDMDVSLSRRKEPEKWGHWKHRGSGIVASWPDAPNQYKPLRGDLMKPGSKGLRLAGRFSGAESSTGFNFGSYRMWGVTFSKDGRFIKDARGGMGSTMAPIAGSSQVMVNTAYDDSGSSTSASGNHVFVGTNTKKRSDSNRGGTYSIDGYTIVLHYDNGAVVRQPFFIDPTNDPGVWFEGAKLAKDKK